ncbi:hypothetical protein RJ639_034171 [Escallonia herrerae]|uniref:Uncharacterized protein n=1 Tax=Escallonia herrerae TaxID=1293975 RepID=A0AA88WUF0_9ASTE|nr:hypothetical protein RJ639_034171 [Escallonia herrerae]
MAPPPPKKTYLPIFLLLFLSSIFYLSLHHSSTSPHHPSTTAYRRYPATPPPPPPPSFTLTIKLLAFDRLPSLSRCLHSLSAARYPPTDTVHLHIYIDHFKIPSGSLDLEQKLNDSRRILDFVDGFSWKYGEKIVHYRTRNVGLQAQWLEAWWPSSDNEFAFVVEDDLEVSPLYYTFIRGLIVNYYYNDSNFSPSVYGASLQRPRFVPGKHGSKIQLDREARLFLYQLVGTWGQLLFPRPWKEFRLWYDVHKTKGIKPALEGMVTTGWYKKMGERIWTPWFIQFIHSRGYFNIYTNFLHERALSISHRDAGVNYGKTAGPDSYLIDKDFPDATFLDMQPLNTLKWYDFCFREVVPDRVVKSFNELGSVLRSVQKQETVLLVSLYKASETDTRNLLCHFERLNIRNYIFMGTKSSFLLDLARRGHPVIDVDQFFGSISAHKALGFQESKLELIKQILVKAYIIKKSLELKYNTWLLDEVMLPISSDLFFNPIDLTYDFYAGKMLKLLFVKSSSLARKIWVDDSIYKIASMVDTKTDKDSVRSNFMYIVANFLEQEGVNLKDLDNFMFGVDVIGSNVNQTLLTDGKKVVYWSSDMGSDLVQKRLEDLGMWLLDGDSSCNAILCHPS